MLSFTQSNRYIFRGRDSRPQKLSYIFSNLSLKCDKLVQKLRAWGSETNRCVTATFARARTHTHTLPAAELLVNFVRRDTDDISQRNWSLFLSFLRQPDVWRCVDSATIQRGKMICSCKRRNLSSAPAAARSRLKFAVLGDIPFFH